MRSPPAAFSALAAAAAVISFAPAQARRPMLGRVVDASGEPVAGATVHAVHVPITSGEGRAVDHLLATTDERGRFRFDAFPCTDYRLWALGAADEREAEYLASDVVHATTGQIRELRTAAPCPIARLEVKGADAWRDHGPLQLRVAPGRVQLDEPAIPLADDGSTELPQLPTGYSQVDILDARGQPLTSARLQVGTKRDLSISLAPPQVVPMRITDDAGEPVTGVRVRQRIDAGWSSDGNLGPTPPARRIWRELGETDEHGHLEATISASRNPFESQGWQNLFFVADKPGCCDTHSGFTNHPFFDGKEVDGEGVTELRFTMRADEPFQGRILRGENGLAGQELAVRIGVKVESKEGNSWRNEDYVRVVTTAEDGSFRVRGVTRIDDEVSVMPTGSPAVREQLPRELHRMAPRQPLALRALKQFPEKGYTVDLAELATLQMQVLDETGGPATDAVVLLLAEVDNDYECDAWTPMAHTDNAGRLAMLVETGRWFLFIRNQTSYAFQTIDVRGGAAADRLDVRLEPMPAMHGKVVDKRGEPLANASVSVHSSSWSSGGNRDKGLEAIANSLNWSWIAAAESDARGMFAIRYLELPGMSYEARLRHEKQSSASFRLEVNDEPQTFVIE